MRMIKQLISRWRAVNIKANAGRYFDGVVHNCCRVSSSNHKLAFVVRRTGIFGGPVIELIDRPENVQLSELDNCVVVKDGKVYELRQEEV